MLASRAYVNHGRWVVDCPRCNSGVLVSGASAVCFECQAELVVEWPENDVRALAEAILGKRPRDNRNWYPDQEGIDDLKTENLINGIEF